MSSERRLRVLALTKYGRCGASSRVRTFQYVPILASSGIHVEISPFLSDAYVMSLQQGRIDFGEVLSAYVRRLHALITSRRFDLLWIEKDALPWVPAWFERLITATQVPYVLDYDDAVYHRYEQHSSLLVRTMLGTKHDTLMRRAALVITGNSYLASRARQSGAARIEIVPTVVDLRSYPYDEPIKHNIEEGAASLPRIVWIGQRSTAKYLQLLTGVMKRLQRERVCSFSAIGVDTEALGLPMLALPWNEKTEATAIRGFDIGIMPLLDGPFERGKCGYKLIQYMACGLPVIASPVGVNTDLVRDGKNGFLATTEAEWEASLRRLCASDSLRHEFGRHGRHLVEQQFSLQVTANRLAGLLRSAVIQS